MRRTAAVVALLLLAAMACANAGTPLLWLGFCYLTVANWIIGLIEAWLLSRMTGIKSPNGLLVAANYASMVAGVGLVIVVYRCLDTFIWNPVRWGGVLIVLMWAASFALTLLVEASFYGKAMRKPWRSREVGRCLLTVNAITYAFLLAIAGLSGTMSLYTVGRWVPKPEDLHPTPAWVYFICDGRIHRIRTDGVREEELMPAPLERGVLSAMTTRDGTRTALFFLPRAYGRSERKIIPNLGPANLGEFEMPNDRFQESAYFYGGARDYRPPHRQEPGVYAGIWPLEGLAVLGQRRYRLAVETPFLSLIWSYPSVLPNGVCVVECSGWIVLVDLPTARYTTLAVGANPTVLLDRPAILPYSGR